MGRYNAMSGKSSRTKAYRARSAVAKAAQLLRVRTTSSSGSYGPPATRGFYGSYSLRGRAELKFVDTTAVNVNVTTSWQLFLVNGVAQGTDFNQRVGRKSSIKSVLFNGNAFPPPVISANSAAGTYMRYVIIYDTQPNSGTLPTGTDIFVNNDPNTAMNLNNRDRFKVLMDVRKQMGSYTMSPAPALIAGSPQNAFWSKYKKCNLETIFSGTAATLGSISTGAIYLCIIGDNPTTSVDYYIRVRFTDL